MVGELVFHLGDRKTGSTSIQRVLATRGFTAKTVRLFYPATDNHTGLAKSLTAEDHIQFREKRFNAVAQKLARSKADIAVISAEYFEEVPPAILRETITRFLPDYADKIRLIAYVRPHAERVVSSYTQQVKMGLFADSLTQFHDKTYLKGRLLYADRFQAWRDEFGDRFELRPMIRSRLFHNSVVDDFLNFALKGQPFQVQTEAHSNESLCVEDLAMLFDLHKTLKKTGMPRRAQFSAATRLAALLAEQPPHPVRTKPLLHAKLAMTIAAAYRQDAEALDAAFFNDQPMAKALDAAVETASEAAFSLTLEDHLSAEELRSFRQLSDLAARLAQAQAKDLSAHFRKAFTQRLEAARATASALEKPKPAKRRQKDKGN